MSVAEIPPPARLSRKANKYTHHLCGFVGKPFYAAF